VPTTQHVKYYSDIIKEKAVTRQLIKSANSISKMAYDEQDPLSRLLERSQPMMAESNTERKTLSKTD
jgi:replicative DNA helicase